MTLTGPRNRVESGVRTLYAWCALAALGCLNEHPRSELLSAADAFRYALRLTRNTHTRAPGCTPVPV
jgi:hypothetical protein